MYHLTNAHTITATTALKEQRGRSNDGNEALFGRAWASPTLAGLQCKTRVYACMYVCLCMAGFSKVFDSVSHQCFLLKLDSVWIRGHILAWIGSFLTNCRRRCFAWWMQFRTSEFMQLLVYRRGLFLDRCYSSLTSITLRRSGLTSCTGLFTDDCTMFREIISHQDCDLFQADLNGLLKWAHKWQLKCERECASPTRRNPLTTLNISTTVLWNGWTPSNILGWKIKISLTGMNMWKMWHPEPHAN